MIVKVTVIKVHERRVPITIYFRYLVISIAFPIPVCDRRASAREGNSDLWTYDGGATMRSSITDVVRDITVECYLRSNIDIGSCEDGQKDKQWYTTFTRD